MKFGEALPQRSVPEWLPYNLDYNEIKQLIKRYTTGKSLVPTAEAKTVFEDEFFEVFMDQLGRIDLFVKSKAGEIDRRIARCNRQVAPLRRRNPIDGLTPRKASRYAKVEQEVERVSFEIQSLSRFVNVQHTGFLKLLKKYKKWTGSSHLTTHFLPILESPTSFHRIDFEKNVLELSDLLVVVRSGFDSFKLAAVTGELNRPARESPLEHGLSLDNSNSKTLISESHAYIDTALAMSSPGANGGGKTTFWVHYDHLIEVQILLMKYLTLQTTSPSSSVPSTPVTRKDSWLGSVGKDDEVGMVVLDDLGSFSDVQGTATIDEVSKAGPRTAGQVRWCSKDSEAVVVVSDASSSILNGNAHSGEALEVKLKRKHVQDLLEMVSDRYNTNFDIADTEGGSELEKIKEWFRKHEKITPLVKLLMKRTRFADTPGGSPVWALLDWDIQMIKITKGSNWMSDSEDDLGKGIRDGTMIEFPHAVLEVQWEGQEMPSFLRELETSHMVESVRGFSLDVHAIAVLYRPKKMTSPFWVSALQKDIRKTPVHTPRHSRRSSSHLMFAAPSSKDPSIGGTSTTAAHDLTDAGFDSSATANDSGSNSAFRSGRKYNRAKSGLSEIESIGGERYWSEFNDATDNEEEPYTILVNYKASLDDGFGDDTLRDFIKRGFLSAGTRIRALFLGRGKEGERQPLFRKSSITSSASSGDIDMEAGVLLNGRSMCRGYDTLSQLDTSQPSAGIAYVYCLGGSTVILVLTAVLALNSTLLSRKHKIRKGGFTLDLEVCGAVLTALILAGTGLVVFTMKRPGVGLLHQAAVWLTFTSVCIGGGVVFAIVGENEAGG